MEKIYHSSNKDTWTTPQFLFDYLNKEFSFDFDPCPFPKPYFDGLEIGWKKSNFVNPPYSNWQQWLKKGIIELGKNNNSVFLLASRTDTKAFHELILPYAKEIRFIKGRLKFGNSQNSAPFPSMIIIFGYDYQPKERVISLDITKMKKY